MGKRKLETALATYKFKSPVDAEVIWRPYQLRPNAPPEGVPKPPDTPDNPRVGSRLKAAGAAVDIDFTGKTDRSPNTLVAHGLLDYALERRGPKGQNEVQEALFRAYFTDGVYPDVEGATSVAVSCGMDREDVAAALSDGDRVRRVQEEVYRNYNAVDGGVPFFLFNGRPAFSGAQDPSSFHNVFDKLL